MSPNAVTPSLRRLAVSSLVLACLVAQGCSRESGAPVHRVLPGGPLPSGESGEEPQSELQRLVASLDGPAVVELAPGRHVLGSVIHVDSSCGNCPEPDESVHASRGLKVSGRGIRIVGADPEQVIIETNAGYGVLFEDCVDCALEGVTVTGGVRDHVPAATDGAVVIKESSVVVRNCHLRDNVGDADTVRQTRVGIGGLVGREGSNIEVLGCRITGNSWDGVALYRGAEAIIRDNVIDGVEAATGNRIGGGRGAGIGLTWDSRAVVEGNLVTRYWKGIGVFVDASATVRHNVVEEIRTWGISVWGAAEGKPAATVEANAVYRTGACGISVARGTPLDEGEVPIVLEGNAVVLTGQNASYDAPGTYCVQMAIDVLDEPTAMVGDNPAYANREAGGTPGAGDVDQRAFRTATRELVDALGSNAALANSQFVRDFS